MAQIKLSLGTYGLDNLVHGDMTKVIDIVKIADDLGFDQVVVTDTLLMTDKTDHYPFGEFPDPVDKPFFEPLTTLAVIAGATRYIRLATGVIAAPLRPAVLLAKTAATLDQLSQGRLDLGVGMGWQSVEYEAVGIPYDRRGARLDDQLRACKVLWKDSPASFSSGTVSFDKVYCRPGPYQQGGIPIWFGVAPTEANCRRIAELGVGWIPSGDDFPKLVDGIRNIRAAFVKAGRDPSELQVRSGGAVTFGDDGSPTTETFAQLERAMEAGVTHLEVWPAFMCNSVEDLKPCLEKIVKIKGD